MNDQGKNGKIIELPAFIPKNDILLMMAGAQPERIVISRDDKTGFYFLPYEEDSGLLVPAGIVFNQTIENLGEEWKGCE